MPLIEYTLDGKVDKVAKAIQRIKSFDPLENGWFDTPYYVAYSGGKDSDVIRILCQLAGVKHDLVHNHTTADAPETVYYIRSIPGIQISPPEMSMWRLFVKKGIPPTRLFRYAADGYNPTPFNWFPDEDGFNGGRDCPRWHPSIYMPKEAAQIFLRVTDVRVERLQDISDSDAIAEGFKAIIRHTTINGNVYNGSTTAREEFYKLWDSLNSKRGYGWDTNPWVWMYEFERVVPDEKQRNTPSLHPHCGNYGDPLCNGYKPQQ